MAHYAPLIKALGCVALVAFVSLLFLSENTYDGLSKTTLAVSSIVSIFIMLRWTPVWERGAIAALLLVVGIAILYGGATLRFWGVMGPLGDVQRGIFRTFLICGSVLAIFESGKYTVNKARSYQWNFAIRARRASSSVRSAPVSSETETKTNG